MRCACIDIGSNTTRLLVADVEGDELREVLHQRAFTRIGRSLSAEGIIAPEKIDEVVAVVAKMRDAAALLGAGRVRTVATAAIRGAANRADFCAAVGDVTILDGHQEAQLAFTGATKTLDDEPDGLIGVVDVGGGSSEIAVGTLAGGVEWSFSFPVGSGSLADRHLVSDPPARAELDAVTAAIRAQMDGCEPPVPAEAVAVGGSATSLRRLVGPVLEPATIERALGRLCGDPCEAVAARHQLEAERVRLLPAGLLILAEAAARLGRPLRVGNGGLREGVLLELGRAGGSEGWRQPPR